MHFKLFSSFFQFLPLQVEETYFFRYGLNRGLIRFLPPGGRNLPTLPEGVNDYKSTLDHIMVWPRLEENPLPVPMMTMLWVNREGSWPRMMCAIRNVLHPAKLCVFLLFCRYLFCSSGMECKTNLINTVGRVSLVAITGTIIILLPYI